MKSFVSKKIFPASILFTTLIMAACSEQGEQIAQDNQQLDRKFNPTKKKQHNLNEFTDKYKSGKSGMSLRSHRGMINFAKSVPHKNSGLVNWFEAGPTDVGGRTRSLAIDSRNSNVLIAASASGGIWKTSNSGDSWSLNSNLDENFSFTSIVQSTTNKDIWYASTGEFGSSAGVYNAEIFGSGGIYKSIDNGDSWEYVGEEDGNKMLYLTSRIVVNSITNSIYVASHGYGVLRSQDGGDTFELVLGEDNGDEIDYWKSNFQYTDIVVKSDGTLIGYLSGELSDGAGFFKSTDDGENWKNITPSDITVKGQLDIARAKMAIAPSNQNVLYAYLQDGTETLGGYGDVAFYKFNVDQETFENRSNNLLKIQYDGGDIYKLPGSNGSYDMSLAVKPDDENFIVIGGSSGGPSRSDDAFATPAPTYSGWYAYGDDPNSISRSYIHNDQHSAVFDPNNPNILWTGHDGGIYMTNDVTGDNRYNKWEEKNNGYNVTQFYDAAISPFADDDRMIGSSQDNAHSEIIWDKNNPVPVPQHKNVVGGGDGLGVWWAKEYILTAGAGGSSTSLFDPAQIVGGAFDEYVFAKKEHVIDNSYSRSFVDHYASINPIDNNYFYKSSGLGIMFRQQQANSLLAMDEDSIPATFSKHLVTELGYDDQWDWSFTGMEFAHTPANRFYFSVSVNRTGKLESPKLFRLENGHTAPISDAIDISSPDFPLDGQLIDVCVNPEDGDEIMAIFSNYSELSIFHSVDAGATYTLIEGNLAGDTKETGPSIRTGLIIPLKDRTLYLVGTNVGIFSTESLSGDQTVWEREGMTVFGASIISDLDYRMVDKTIAVGTHGRGIFIGKVNESMFTKNTVSENITASVYPNPISSSSVVEYQLKSNSIVTIEIFDVQGKLVQTSLMKQQQNRGKQTIPLKINNWSKGTYIVKGTMVSENGNSSFVQKITLQ